MNQIKKVKEILSSELAQIRKLKKIVEKSMKKMPEGSLVISKSNGVIQFFHKTEKTQKKGKYIKKSEKKFITALAQKDYDQALHNELTRQEGQLEKALKALPEREIINVFNKLTETRKELVNPHIISDEEYVNQWLSKEYEGNDFWDEYKKFKTERGELVRSKSEKIIADKLYKMGIPYKYECPLRTKKMGTIYPDFTILIVSSRQEVYLEHFGLMDVPEYCEKTLLRIQSLAKEGIVFGKNLFATFESSTVPLDVGILEFLKWL